MSRYNGAGSDPSPPRRPHPALASETCPGQNAKVMAARASAATQSRYGEIAPLRSPHTHNSMELLSSVNAAQVPDISAPNINATENS